MIDTNCYIRMLFGAHAVRVPVRIGVQRTNDELLAAVLMAQHSPEADLTFGSGKTHQLIIGDAVIRPHVVLETDEFAGRGLGGLALTTMDEWVEAGSILINPAGLKLNTDNGGG